MHSKPTTAAAAAVAFVHCCAHTRNDCNIDRCCCPLIGSFSKEYGASEANMKKEKKNIPKQFCFATLAQQQQAIFLFFSVFILTATMNWSWVGLTLCAANGRLCACIVMCIWLMMMMMMAVATEVALSAACARFVVCVDAVMRQLRVASSSIMNKRRCESHTHTHTTRDSRWRSGICSRACSIYATELALCVCVSCECWTQEPPKQLA